MAAHHVQGISHSIVGQRVLSVRRRLYKRQGLQLLHADLVECVGLLDALQQGAFLLHGSMEVHC